MDPLRTKCITGEAESQVHSLAPLKTFGRWGLPWRLLHLYLLAISLLLFAGGFLWFRSQHVLAGNTDFTIYYTALQVVRRYSFSHLYNLEIQSVVQREILDGSLLAGGLLPFNHPPFEVLLFMPLGTLGFRSALLCWLFANLALVFLLPKGLQWLLPGLSGRSLTLRLSALSFYPFLVCLWQGQDSIAFLWLLVLFLGLLKRGETFWAGCALGVAFIKFHLAYFFIVLLLFERKKLRAIGGLFVSLSVLVAWSASVLGIEGMKAYANMLLRLVGTEGHLGFAPERMHTWAAQIYLLGMTQIHSLGGVLGLAFLAAALLWLILKRTQESDGGLELRFAITLLLAILSSPHLYLHDLSAVFLAAIICFDSLLKTNERREWFLASCVLLLISPVIWLWTLPLSQRIPIQLSVLWMTAAFLMCTRMVIRSHGFNEGSSNT